MTEVCYEREWERPLTDADLERMDAESAVCLELYRVDWQGSLLSRDRRRLLCHFSGPDAESVRMAVRHTGGDVEKLWPCTVHDAPALDDALLERANVVVMREFDEAVALEDLQAIEDANIGCLETHNVRFARTFFSTDGKRMACLYAAPDAESVRIAQRQAGMPFDAAWAFERVRPARA
jgi:hypothetical protein